LFDFILLAEAATGGGGAGTPPPQPGGLDSLLITFVPLMIIFYLFFIRPENKRRKQKEELLAAIKPKDKVVTVGGLHGSVVEVEGDEVVLLVDPKKDVKLRFRRSAIDTIETPEEKK
jgi:preprotein translocase subunit YajC